MRPMTQMTQSGGSSLPQDSIKPEERRWRAQEKLAGLFYTCPIPVARSPLSSEWSREYLRLFTEGNANPHLLTWARERDLPSSLCELGSVAEHASPRYISIFEQLREIYGEVAFRPEHLSADARNKLRRIPETGFVGPYAMPAIGTVLPLLSGLIIAYKWPEFLDAPRPARKPENTSWKRERRFRVSETRSWHW